MLPNAAPASRAATMPQPVFLHKVEFFTGITCSAIYSMNTKPLAPRPLPSAEDDAPNRHWRSNFAKADQTAIREFQYSNMDDYVV